MKNKKRIKKENNKNNMKKKKKKKIGNSEIGNEHLNLGIQQCKDILKLSEPYCFPDVQAHLALAYLAQNKMEEAKIEYKNLVHICSINRLVGFMDTLYDDLELINDIPLLIVVEKITEILATYKQEDPSGWEKIVNKNLRSKRRPSTVSFFSKLFEQPISSPNKRNSNVFEKEKK